MRIISKNRKELPKVPKGTSFVVFVVVFVWVQVSWLILVRKTSDRSFRTVIEPVLRVLEKNFNFRREKYLHLSLDYQK